MSDQNPALETTWARLSRPEMLIAFSAVLLSLCGLFVSIYETSLIRKQQRASVWPHLGIGYSHTGDQFSLMVANLGVGPARIRDVLVTVDGLVVRDWPAMFEKLGIEGPQDYLYSSFSQMVIPSGDRHRILWIEAGTAPDDSAGALIRQLVDSRSRLGITVCYSSVYDEYWRTRLGSAHPEQISRRDCAVDPSQSFRM